MRLRAAVAGIVGLVVALGITALVHGLYDLVPSVLGRLAQVVVEWTPGGIVTQGIELLGKADIPVLIASVILGTLAVSALLGILAVRRPALALLGVALLAAIGIAVSFVEPFIDTVATVATGGGGPRRARPPAPPPALALPAVALLAAIGIAVSFVEPFIDPVATVATVVGGLLAGTVVAEMMLRAPGRRGPGRAAPD